VAGSCECGNNPSDSVKYGEFLEYLLASQEGIYSMKFVSLLVIMFC
jgi:hypothetical protein